MSAVLHNKNDEYNIDHLNRYPVYYRLRNLMRLYFLFSDKHNITLLKTFPSYLIEKYTKLISQNMISKDISNSKYYTEKFKSAYKEYSEMYGTEIPLNVFCLFCSCATYKETHIDRIKSMFEDLVMPLSKINIQQYKLHPDYESHIDSYFSENEVEKYTNRMENLNKLI